jgi:hypothetical protein
MAKRQKNTSNTSIETDPDRPESWLYLINEGSLIFGVLREKYKGRANTAAEFGARKLQPVSPPEEHPKSITAERADVVLPKGAEDHFSEPFAFLRGCDEMRVDPGILTYVTIPMPDANRIHEAWETAREFAKILAQERDLAVLVIQHVPGRVSSPNDPHVHLLINPRICSKLGLAYGGLDRALLHDEGAEILAERWAEFIAENC